MTRAEFIREYAARSGLPEVRSAALGFLELDGYVFVALPCGCGDENCDGWAMVPSTEVDHHLSFYALEVLRTAYLDAVRAYDSV